MKNRPNDFRLYFQSYASELFGKDSVAKPFDFLDKYPLLPSQAIYVFDMKNLRISYQKGLGRLLGYEKGDFNFDVLCQWYHPDDFDRYMNLLKMANQWIREQKPEPFAIEATYDYRLRQKNGDYMKVLRQSTVFENCTDGCIKSSFSILSNISCIKEDTGVNLSLIGLESGQIILEDKTDASQLPQFTNREIEILAKVRDGLDSKTIADLLCISRHTVDTHRRKILSKTECRNMLELVQYATRMGVI
jgi:DNA-binding CsgD family transcriptional regulator